MITMSKSIKFAVLHFGYVESYGLGNAGELSLCEPYTHLDTPPQPGGNGNLFDCEAPILSDVKTGSNNIMAAVCRDQQGNIYKTRYVVCMGRHSKDTAEITYDDVQLKIRIECWRD